MITMHQSNPTRHNKKHPFLQMLLSVARMSHSFFWYAHFSLDFYEHTMLIIDCLHQFIYEDAYEH